MAPLTDLEKAAFQLLMNRGVIEDSLFCNELRQLSQEFGQLPQDKSDIFKKINANIRPFSFEIKTLVEGSADNWVYHHGLINTAEDEVSKEYGTRLTAHECKFFSELLAKLVGMNFCSTRDICEFELDPTWSTSFTGSQINDILQKLEDQGWLRRNDRNHWILGLRTHLELRNAIEDEIKSNDDTVESDKQMADLPQILLY